MKAKYKIGQKVWYMCDNTVNEEVVVGILAASNGIVYYYLTSLDAGDEIKPWNGEAEGSIFPDKKSLIASL